DVAAPARQHEPGRLTAGQKAGIAGHFPDLAENPLSRFQNREVDVRADVEDANFQRRMLVCIVQEGDDLVFLASVERTGVNLSTGSLDVLDEGSQLFAVTTAGEDREAFCGKLLGDL